MCAAFEGPQQRFEQLSLKALQGDVNAKYELGLLHNQKTSPYYAEQRALSIFRELAKLEHNPSRILLFQLYSDPASIHFSPSRALFWHKVSKDNQVDPYLIACLQFLDDQDAALLEPNLHLSKSTAYYWYQGLQLLSAHDSRQSLINARHMFLQSHQGGLDMTRWLSLVNVDLFSPVVAGVSLFSLPVVSISSELQHQGYERVMHDHSDYVTLQLSNPSANTTPSIILLSSQLEVGQEVALFFKHHSADFINQLRSTLIQHFGPMGSLEYHRWKQIGIEIEWKWLTDSGHLKLTYIRTGEFQS